MSSTVTVTPGKTAPDESVAVPRISPVLLLWERAGPAIQTTRQNANAKRSTLFMKFLPPEELTTPSEMAFPLNSTPSTVLLISTPRKHPSQFLFSSISIFVLPSVAAFSAKRMALSSEKYRYSKLFLDEKPVFYLFFVSPKPLCIASGPQWSRMQAFGRVGMVPF
jgi:hypothetical protein